jgi:putative phosphoesterase
VKVGLIADIHGNSPAFRSVLAALRGRVDCILFLGDLVGYYAFVNECAEEWETNQITAILGNHDQILIECLAQGKEPDESYCVRYGSALTRCLRQLSPQARSLIASWPQHRSLTLEGVSVAMFHGAPWMPLEGRVYPDFAEWDRFDSCPEEVILLGHTHYPMVKKWRGKTIINPGSVGQPRSRSGGAGAEFAVLDVAQRSAVLERVPYDVSRLVQDAQLHDPQMNYLVEVLRR